MTKPDIRPSRAETGALIVRGILWAVILYAAIGIIAAAVVVALGH